jgi:RNA polymerase sigma-70 factor, ECF subfamily
MSEVFEAQRPFLRGLAYRLLSSVSEVEDVMQDAWLRWHATDQVRVANPRAFLARIVTNLCLDHLSSARVQREQYVGQWLPEPLVDDTPAMDPAGQLEIRHDVSCAFLQLLERLSPLERAAFVLHEVFDFSFEEIAVTIERSTASCRQLATRARRHLRDARPRYQISVAAGKRMCETLLNAIARADSAALAELLTEDVVFYSDGGGKMPAVPKPLIGSAQVARVIIGFASLYQPAEIEITQRSLNGDPGFVVRSRTGAIIQTVTCIPAADGRVSAFYVQRNPDKLRHLT